ncbi:kinase-like domain-containing protein [Dactylonectria macrodidyma]|uniref:Kinase-like domain-containing protein n=1 Tax=Dactylonectria macrodidyma TaxID=307937 RepID=A0A9P9IB26_9HYPO|nr:kinase-like domain-containing protein [Dactylonectria macrodidyma]
MSTKIRDSVRQIDDNSWLIGNKLLLRRTSVADNWLWHTNGLYYTLSDDSPLFPAPETLPTDSYVRPLYSSANVTAVWRFGDAFLKIKLFQGRRDATTENVTLDWLAKENLSFATPRTFYYTKGDDRSYLFSSRVPGETLAEAWQGMNEDDKTNYACRIAEICEELSIRTSEAITGVDGRQLPDNWLHSSPTPYDFRPETLRENCTQLGMRTSTSSTFVFCHNDLGPGNIVINSGQVVGIIDWEIAGYVPCEWIRTKFSVGWGMDFNWDNDPSEWRLRVEYQLRRKGFPEVTEAWKKWREERFQCDPKI